MPALDAERERVNNLFDHRVGALIRSIRIEKGIEQQQLARTVNISVSALSRAENGTRALKFREGLEICKALGIRPWDLAEQAGV